MIEPGREVREQAALIADVAAQRELAAAGGAGDVVQLQPVLVEDGHALEIAQAVRNAIHGEIGVVEADLSVERGIL